jgi:hypothetical protein
MLAKLLVALLLMALCVAIHAVGLTAAVRRLNQHAISSPLPFTRSVGVLIAISAWAILLHLLEIAVWAFFYALEHGMPDLPTALYFSAVTYTRPRVTEISCCRRNGVWSAASRPSPAF